MNPFQSLRDDEEFIYTLKQRFPSVDMSFTQPDLPALIREVEELLKK